MVATWDGQNLRVYAATGPVGCNGAPDVSLNVVLTWTPGAYVTESSPKHKVFLSNDFDVVNDGIGGGVQDANTYTPPEPLAWGQTYYWRVDEANSTTGWDQGDIWQFTVESFDPFMAGPYVHFYNRGEVTVYWKTEITVPSVIEYGVKPNLSQTITDPVAKTEHALKLTDIRPETDYSYRMIADGIASATYGFYSAFNHGPDSFPGGACPYPVDSLTPLYEQAAEYIINATGITKGVCIDYGCGCGRLAYEIAKRSNLKIVGFEEDTDKVAEGRDYLDKADIYGTRVTILSAPATEDPEYEHVENLQGQAVAKTGTGETYVSKVILKNCSAPSRSLSAMRPMSSPCIYG